MTTPSQLSKETIERIEKEVLEMFPIDVNYSFLEETEVHALRESYRRGAKSEAEKALPVIQALEKIRKDMPDGSWFAKTIDKALKEYNNE